jgi:hypothetical protein
MALAPRFERRAPRFFTGRALSVLYGIAALASVPILGAFMVISLKGFTRGPVVFLVAAVLLVTYFLPVAFGNGYIARLARGVTPPPGAGGRWFLVQVKLVPRLYTGLRAILDDADDIGWVRSSPEGIEYVGDALSFTVPRAQIVSIRRRAFGARGLSLCGDRMECAVSGIEGVETVEFTERASRSLAGSRRIAGELYGALCG